VALDGFEHLHVEVAAPVEEEDVHALVEIAECLERIAHRQLDQIGQAGVGQVLRCDLRLARQQLARDELPAAAVPERRGEVDRAQAALGLAGRPAPRVGAAA
jgi:hypothetical protein